MVAWLALSCFLLKVPLVFINHGGGYGVEIKGAALHSRTPLSSGSRKANRLPVFQYIQTYLLACSLNSSLSQNFLAVWTTLILAAQLSIGTSPFPQDEM